MDRSSKPACSHCCEVCPASRADAPSPAGSVGFHDRDRLPDHARPAAARLRRCITTASVRDAVFPCGELYPVSCMIFRGKNTMTDKVIPIQMTRRARRGCAAFRRRAARGHARPADARPAHLGHRPLQLPLHLLHAARGVRRELQVPAARRDPQLRGDRAPGAHLRRPGREEDPPHRRRAAAAARPAGPGRDARRPLGADLTLTTNGSTARQAGGRAGAMRA